MKFIDKDFYSSWNWEAGDELCQIGKHQNH